MNRRIFFVIFLWACLFFPITVLGQDFDQIMMEGVGHYKAGDYAKAIESFKAAQAIDAIPDITYNIARSYHLLGDCALALDYYRQYALTGEENAASVESYITSLTSQCGTKRGTLDLRCSPEAAFVSLDGAAPVRCTGLHEVEAGTHRLEVMALSYGTQTREVDVVQNQTHPVSIDLLPQPVVGVGQEAHGQECARGNGTPLFWTGIGLSGAGLVASLTGVALAATAHRSITFNGISNIYERSTTKLVGGTVTASLGLVAIAAGVSLILVDYFKAQSSADSIAFVPSIAVDPEGASASLYVRF